MDVKGIIRSLIEQRILENSNSLNDIVWSKNVIKPGTKTSATKKYKAGDKVKYAGKICTVVGHDDKGFVTLSNPEWSKNRIVPHTAVSSIKESLDEDTKEEIVEQFNTEKSEARVINDKKYIGLNLLWNGKKFGEVRPHTAISQTKSRGSNVATSQKKVVRWEFRLDGIKLDRYELTNGFTTRDDAAQAALKLYRKSMEESLDEDAKADYEKVRALMPSSMPVDKWIPIKNGFEAIVSSKGSYTLRRKVKMAGELRYEKFSLTRSGGLKSLGFSRIEESLDEASDDKLTKAMSIINAGITKPGQPPKYPSFDSAPEDIKTAARNLAKNMR